ncbi:MAG: FtsX-like permease family protein [Thermomicrobiales bacterium]|nr:FtsX-like permease family protein [Thermomicrobiales bacterium]
MTELFGIPMSTIVVALAAMLAICLLSIAWVWTRRRVIFKLGARNIPRRKAQTALIVFGLMLSTLIVTAALGTGDTVNGSMTSEVYASLGQIDQVVANPIDDDLDGNSFSATIPESAWTDLQPAIDGIDQIDGASPFLERRASVRDVKTGAGLPEIVVMGIDLATVDSLGGLGDPSGTRAIDLDVLPDGAVILSQQTAADLSAQPGDTIELFIGDRNQEFTVATVVESNYLSGMRRDNDTGEEISGLVMRLSDLQQLSGLEGEISGIALSNTGGVRDGLDHDLAVQQALQSSVDEAGLSVNPLKQNWLDLANLTASVFTGLFLVVGLFSISAGILLILLIFTMLAAERRAEMGMARAVGAQRSSLVQQFMSEGTLYALLAGLVGSALGVGVAYLISRSFASVFGEYAHVQTSISATSVIAGYCLGVVITFLAVVVSSWRISRLNIVAAVRDLPDAQRRRRAWRTYLWQALMVAGGVLLTLQGVSSSSAMAFTTGVSLLTLSIALILRQVGLSSRLVFTAAGLFLLVFWLLPDNIFERIFGTYEGDFEMFFVSGIFLVVSSTLVIMQNDRALLGLVSRLGSIFRSRGAALKLGVAYPGAARSRTGMTIAMFSLIVFSLVMIATINLNFERAFLGDSASAGWDIEAKTANNVPLDDLGGQLEAGGMDPDSIAGIGALTRAADGRVALPGSTDWKDLDFTGMDAGYLADTEWEFIGRAAGYPSDAAILDAIQHEPGVAVVDSFLVSGMDDPALTGLFESIEATDQAFTPLELQVRNGEGTPETITVIGVIAPKLSTFVGLYASDATAAPLLQTDAETSYVVKLSDRSQAADAAGEIQSIMLPSGVKATSFQQQIEENQESNRGFFRILESFMGLGLIVGIAAIGVISFRNVIERRQQIGVLRAIGFQRGLVSWTFLIEAAFVVGLGVLSGTALGLMLARNLLTGNEMGATGDISFVVPWSTVGFVLALAVVASLITTWLPARQASRIVPAEALRYE